MHSSDSIYSTKYLFLNVYCPATKKVFENEEE